MRTAAFVRSHPGGAILSHKLPLREVLYELVGGFEVLEVATAMQLLEEGGYYLQAGHFVLASLHHSSDYLNLRVALMTSAVADMFAVEMAGQLVAQGTTGMAASSVGGILLGAAVSTLSGIPLLVGRQTSRDVQWLNADEIQDGAAKHLTLIDDVLTTSATVLSSLAALDRLGIPAQDIAVAVDRRDAGDSGLRSGGRELPVLALMPLALRRSEESSCPDCAARKPLVDLSNPEEDFLAVVLSMPDSMAETISSGYRHVYEVQGDVEQIRAHDALKPWLPSLLAGLPRWRVGEDSRFVQFIRGVTSFVDNPVHRRVLVELVGNLLALTNIRVEARSLGCAVVVGEREHVDRFFGSESAVQPENGSVTGWASLVAYFDALMETENVFAFDVSGRLLSVRHLTHATTTQQARGTQLLREVTANSAAVAFLVRRERRAIYVYRDGGLANVAELSEKTGVWDFTAPGPNLAIIENKLPGISQTLETVLEVCREMASKGYGGLFVVGDRSPSLRHEPPHVRVVRQPLRFLDTGEASEIAKLDGAVFVSAAGEIEQASVIIRNSEREPGRAAVRSRRRGGARSQTAFLTSIECPNAAVVLVSQNGTIEVHVNGESFPVAKAFKGALGDS